MTKQSLLLPVIMAGVLFVLYLSWLPSPDFGTHWYFPSWLATWTNIHGQLRTAVPFVFLGVLSELMWNSSGQMKKRLALLLVFFVVVTVAEAGQLYLPGRYFDWADIGLGTAGGAVGLAIGALLNRTGYFRQKL